MPAHPPQDPPGIIVPVEESVLKSILSELQAITVQLHDAGRELADVKEGQKRQFDRLHGRINELSDRIDAVAGESRQTYEIAIGLRAEQLSLEQVLADAALMRDIRRQEAAKAEMLAQAERAQKDTLAPPPTEPGP